MRPDLDAHLPKTSPSLGVWSACGAVVIIYAVVAGVAVWNAWIVEYFWTSWLWYLLVLTWLAILTVFAWVKTGKSKKERGLVVLTIMLSCLTGLKLSYDVAYALQ